MNRKTTVMMAILLLLSFGLIGSGITESADTRSMTQFQGKVTDAETGEPLEKASVMAIHNVTNKFYRARTDGDGYYLIDLDTSGEYRLIASKEEYETGEKFADVDFGKIERVDFQLEPEDLNSTIFGNVYEEESGEPVAKVHIYLINLDMDYKYSVRSDEEGYYEKNVVPGNYTIEVFEQNYHYYESDPFMLEDGEKKKADIPLEKVKNGINGVVTDEDGEPLEMVEIQFQSENFFTNQVTDEEGKYEVRLPPGEYKVSARKASYRPHNNEVEVPENEMVRYDIEMKQSPVLGFLERILTIIWELLGM